MAEQPRRIFRWGAQVLDDPDPGMTPEEVRDLYAGAYPELTTAAIEITEGDSGEVTFAKKGTTAVAKSGTQNVSFVPSQGKRG